jgi:iron complex outermembrane receptor protein
MKPLSIALALVSAAPLGSQAQPADGAPVKSLGTVTVTGGQPTSLPTQIPTTIEGVTREQVERAINAMDSEDALKYLPSLLVRKRYVGDYNHAVLSTRASGTGNPARSMVYADGILLSNYLGNGPTNAPRWMLVTPEEIERVDVLYGPFSAAYAGNSVGAVVDYVTRMPTRFEAHAKVATVHQPFTLYGTDGSFGAQQASASLGNRSGDWSWWLNVNRTESDGQPLTFATRLVSQGTPGGAGVPVSGAVPGRSRTDADWLILGTGTQYRSTQDHLKVKAAYELSAHWKATYTFGWWHNRSAGEVASYLRDPAGQAVYSGPVNIAGRSYTLLPSDFAPTREQLTHLMHGLSLKSHTRGSWDWEAAVSRYDLRDDILRSPTTALPAAAAGGPGRIVDQGGTGWWTLALKGIWRPGGPQGAHIVDFGYQRDTYSLRSVENATADWLAGAAAARNQAFSGDTRLQALYAQDAWRLAPRWQAVLGARVEQWSAFGGQTSGASASARHPERRQNHVSPKAAIAWQASDAWVWKFSAGRAVRMPTVSELYQGGVSAGGVLTNNDPNLRPEKSWTQELTAERELRDGTLRFTAFFETTRDALYAQTNVTVTPNVTNIQNVDRIRTHGLEVAYQEADVLRRGLDLAGSLTWADSRITRNDKFPASVGKRQPRVPEWRATALVTWRPDDRWSYTLGARYSGKQFSTLDNSDPNGFAYQGASPYFTVDARVRLRFAKVWSVAVGVDNLNRDKYWNFHPYPQRSWFAELKADL